MASPPHRALSPGVPLQPLSISRRQLAGVACMIVVREALRSSSRVMPSVACSRVAMTVVAPALSGRKSSSTEMSNESVVTASRRSSAVIRLACAPCSRGSL